MVNIDLTRTLEQLRCSAKKKLEKMGDIIYQYGAERFGVKGEKEVLKRFQPHQFPEGSRRSSVSSKKGDSSGNGGTRPLMWKRTA